MLNVNRRYRAQPNRGGHMNPLPWRTVLYDDNTGRFSQEEIDRAVRSVIVRREWRKPGRPGFVAEPRREYGVPSPPRESPAAPGEPVPYGPPRRGGRRKRKGPAEG